MSHVWERAHPRTRREVATTGSHRLPKAAARHSRERHQALYVVGGEDRASGHRERGRTLMGRRESGGEGLRDVETRAHVAKRSELDGPGQALPGRRSHGGRGAAVHGGDTKGVLHPLRANFSTSAGRRTQVQVSVGRRPRPFEPRRVSVDTLTSLIRQTET